jgi:putative heme-binding domain-containing protein
MSSRLLLATLALACPGLASAQPLPPGPDLKPARDAVRSAVNKGTISGAVAYVGQAGRPLLFETFGRAGDDRKRLLVAVVMTQVYPWGASTLWADFQKAVYAGLGDKQVSRPPSRNGPALALRGDSQHDGKDLRLPVGAKQPDPNELRTVAMNRPGNARKGKDLFASAALRCAVCHKVHGHGGDSGPDLSQVAGKLDRTHLIESVLDPSAQILEGFRTTVVELKDGRLLTGLVSNESAGGFTLSDAENKKHAVAAADVEQRHISPASLMPADLCAALSPADFTDLIAYLDSLRTGRKLSPGEGVTGAVSLPAGFRVEAVAGGLTGGTALEVAPDGRVFVCEQTGSLRVVKDGRLLPEPFVKLPVASTWERGLLGVTVAPDFPRTPHVFVCYVAARPHPHHVISRLTAAGDVAEPASELILFEGDDQTHQGGNKIDGHQGGALHFGSDGKLYVAIGEQTAEQPAQNLNSLLGKVLRLNPDGSIPDDNPFVREAKGKYRAVWALGCRNPFAFAVQRQTGRIFINDVGGKAEEVNEGVAGANYGWPTADHGPTTNPKFRGPVHHYPTACITGGAFVPRDSPWPAEYRGKYLFADFNHGFLRTIDPDRPEKSSAFATGLRRPVDLRFAPNGDLYVYVRDAWVIDNQFQPGTGSVLRIRHEGKKREAGIR